MSPESECRFELAVGAQKVMVLEYRLRTRYSESRILAVGAQKVMVLESPCAC